MFDGSDMRYHVHKDLNINFDEKGNNCGTVRSVQWLKGDKEPDPSKAKLEIRKFTVKEDGERALKGYVFSTEDGPHELVEGMIGAGYGRTKPVLRHLRKRDDFEEAVKTIDEDDDSSEGETFDMRDLLLRLSSEDNEEE